MAYRIKDVQVPWTKYRLFVFSSWFLHGLQRIHNAVFGTQYFTNIVVKFAVMVLFILFLFFLCFMVEVNVVSNRNDIVLQSNEGICCSVNYIQWQQSGLIRSWFDDDSTYLQQQDIVFSLPSVSSHALDLIVDFMEKYAHTPFPNIDLPVTTTSMSNLVCPWACVFADALVDIQRCDGNDLLLFFAAAHYMDIPHALQLVQMKIATMLNQLKAYSLKSQQQKQQAIDALQQFRACFQLSKSVNSTDDLFFLEDNQWTQTFT